MENDVVETELIPLVAERFKALADPRRLALLSALQGGERSVSELAKFTKRPQPNVSQHLASLASAGLVEARKEGNRVFYRIADPYVTRICDAVCDSVVARARSARKRHTAVVRARRRRVGGER
jgi:DNA-binding transcriptional ArsR family regulator